MQCKRPQFDSWVRKICWRRDRLPTPVFLGFPCGSAGKESARNAGDLGSIPGLGRSPGEGKGYPLQYSGLENSTGCIVRGVIKSWTRLSNLQFTSKVCWLCDGISHLPPTLLNPHFVSWATPFHVDPLKPKLQVNRDYRNPQPPPQPGF